MKQIYNLTPHHLYGVEKSLKKMPHDGEALI